MVEHSSKLHLFRVELPGDGPLPSVQHPQSHLPPTRVKLRYPFPLRIHSDLPTYTDLLTDVQGDSATASVHGVKGARWLSADKDASILPNANDPLVFELCYAVHPKYLTYF
jgi:hypothetical protein